MSKRILLKTCPACWQALWETKDQAPKTKDQNLSPLSAFGGPACWQALWETKDQNPKTKDQKLSPLSAFGGPVFLLASLVGDQRPNPKD